MPRPCLDTVDSLYITVLSLSSGMSLQRLWSPSPVPWLDLSGKDLRQILSGMTPCPSISMIVCAVLCRWRVWLVTSSSLPTPREGSFSRKWVLFQRDITYQKNHKQMTFPETFAALLPAWAPTPACSLEQPRLMIFWQVIQNVIAFALSSDSVFLFWAWRICRVRADPGTFSPKGCLQTASSPSTWKLPWTPLQINAWSLQRRKLQGAFTH